MLDLPLIFDQKHSIFQVEIIASFVRIFYVFFDVIILKPFQIGSNLLSGILMLYRIGTKAIALISLSNKEKSALLFYLLNRTPEIFFTFFTRWKKQHLTTAFGIKRRIPLISTLSKSVEIKQGKTVARFSSPN